MNLIKSIETSIGKVMLYESPYIMKTIFKPMRIDSLKEAEQHIISSYSLLEGKEAPPPDLVDIRQLKGMSKVVRDYFGNSQLIKKNTLRSAILINSGISRIIGNIYLRFSKQDFPTKLFTDEEKALEWLFMNKIY